MITGPGRSRLAALIEDAGGAALALPPGRVVSGDDGPLLWLRDGEPDAATVARLRALHATSGLWPVLVGDDPGWDADPRVATGPTPGFPDMLPFHPLLDGHLGKSRPRGPEVPDAESWLAEQWAEAIAENEENDYWEPEERVSALAPAGAAWPGLAPGAEPAHESAAPLAIADWYAAMMLDEKWLGRPRLALFEGADGSSALAAARWAPSECDDFAAQIEVLRTWERRFGARVVALKPSTLYLSVAAPPAGLEHAVHVACEHLAFSQDTVWQCSDSFEEHAQELVGSSAWSFWWD